nr:hypothetical protein [Qaidamihabitans albus]
MTPHSAERTATRLARALAQRGARAEAVGVLRAWNGYDTPQAQDHLHDCPGDQETEAARIAEAVNAAAHSQDDPDWE